MMFIEDNIALKHLIISLFCKVCGKMALWHQNKFFITGPLCNNPSVTAGLSSQIQSYADILWFDFNHPSSHITSLENKWS